MQESEGLRRVANSMADAFKAAVKFLSERTALEATPDQNSTKKVKWAREGLLKALDALIRALEEDNDEKEKEKPGLVQERSGPKTI